MTSAYDIALMTRELAQRYPEVFKYTKIWMDTIIHKTKKGEKEFGLSNTNKLIRQYHGCTGMKTGSTGKAGFCLSATARRNTVSYTHLDVYKRQGMEIKRTLNHPMIERNDDGL